MTKIKDEYIIIYTFTVIIINLMVFHLVNPIMDEYQYIFDPFNYYENLSNTDESNKLNIELYAPTEQHNSITDKLQYIPQNKSSISEQINTLFKLSKRDEKSIMYLKSLIINNEKKIKYQQEVIKEYKRKTELLEIKVGILTKR